MTDAKGRWRQLQLAAGVVLGLVFGANEAHAVVGMPATPVSYAGVARRSMRRNAYAAGVEAGASAAPVGTVTTLPAGCAEVVQAGVVYQRCGGTMYRPTYQGTNVVYVVGQ